MTETFFWSEPIEKWFIVNFQMDAANIQMNFFFHLCTWRSNKSDKFSDWLFLPIKACYQERTEFQKKRLLFPPGQWFGYRRSFLSPKDEDTNWKFRNNFISKSMAYFSIFGINFSSVCSTSPFCFGNNWSR